MKLKLYHKLLPLFIIPICMLISVIFGWLAFTTITDRPGYNGYAYIYYGVSRATFAVYKGFIAFSSFSFIVAQLIYLIKANPVRLSKIFWYFLLFMTLLIVCEIYLATRYVGKG